MNLKNIMLSEMNQSQKDKYCMIFLLYEVSRVVKLIETITRMVAAGSWRRGKWAIFLW